MLTIPQLTEKMIAFSGRDTADIHHFLCVWAYAKTIGEAEGLDEKTLFLLEATAIIHDISWSRSVGKIRQYGRQASGGGKPSAGA